MVDIRQDDAPALENDQFEKDGYVYNVDYNEFMLSFDAQIFKKYTNERGNIGMSQIAYGVGPSKQSAIADAEKKLSS
tara:strand:+ start:5146 stop:5376 length:231 start_codon:yes stop_codon:yes gene_type:complete